MNEKELQTKRRFWFLKFERLSNQNDKLQTEIERMKKIVDRSAVEIVQVVQELNQIKQQEQKMSFENIVLEKQ